MIVVMMKTMQVTKMAMVTKMTMVTMQVTMVTKRTTDLCAAR